MALHELNHRTAASGAIQVSLDWDDLTNELTLTLTDERGTSEWPVSPDEATLAYEHPYAWLAGQPRKSQERITA